MKIHIIGCSGSGKTYLANKLSDKYHVPHFDLDDIQWDNNSDSYGVKRPLEEKLEMLQKICTYDAWIIEGVYYAWVQQSFEEADVIYVLDMPLFLCKIRIMWRFVKRKLHMEKGKRESLKSLYQLLKWTNVFQKKNRQEIKLIMEKYKEKVVYIKSSKDVRKVIEETQSRY